MKLRTPALALLAASMLIPASAQASYEMYLVLNPATQQSSTGTGNRVFSQTSMSAATRGAAPTPGKTPISGFVCEVSMLHDPSSGMATGKRVHKPFEVTKALDAMSTILFQAVITNQTIPEIQILVMETDAAGRAMPVFQYTLTNVSVASYSDHPGSDPNSRDTETVDFTYQRIEVQYVPTRTVVMDDWNR